MQGALKKGVVIWLGDLRKGSLFKEACVDQAVHKQARLMSAQIPHHTHLNCN
jgi:hypothetical protein